MRLQSRKPVPTSRTREERLREGSAAAQTIRAAAPRAVCVEVRLQFLPDTAPRTAAQSFLLYPSARAFFAYPCPHGDCDGIYDLSAAAERILAGEKKRVSGVVECGGLRSGHGLQRQHCGLNVNYTISAQLSPEKLR